MDKIDDKILQELCFNARISSTEIAKRLNVPRHVVNYRKQRFFDRGIIRGSEIVLDYKSLGYQEFIVFIKLFHYQEIKEEFEKFVKTQKHVRWCVEVFPDFNIRMVIVAKNLTDFEKFFEVIEKRFKDNVLKKKVLLYREYLKTGTYFSNKSNEKKFTGAELSSSDKLTLLKISENPTSSFYELSKLTNMSIEGVRKKLNSFIDSGVVIGIQSKVKVSNIGINFWCTILLQINNFSKHKKFLVSLLNSSVDFGRTRFIFGQWNVEMTVFVNDYSELTKIIHKLETTFENDLEEYNLLIYLKKNFTKRAPQKVIFLDE